MCWVDIEFVMEKYDPDHFTFASRRSLTIELFTCFFPAEWPPGDNRNLPPIAQIFYKLSQQSHTTIYPCITCDKGIQSELMIPLPHSAQSWKSYFYIFYFAIVMISLLNSHCLHVIILALLLFWSSCVQQQHEWQ